MDAKTMHNALLAPFSPEQVSWRAQSLTKDGTKAMALAYIDARDVMKRLDEVCGVAGWQCEYPHATDKKTICSIGIKFGDEWIWKADGAGDTDVEAEKGAISDAFKRAAVKWGIGRYLYDASTPWVPCDSYKKGDKFYWSKWKENPWNYVKGSTTPVPPSQSASAAESPFASSAERMIFRNNVMTSYEQAISEIKLKELAMLNKVKTDAMKASGDAEDIRVLNELSASYKARVAELKNLDDEIPF